MKVVAQMDEISSIDIDTDSTFAILLECQNRGHEIFYYLPKELKFDLSLGVVSAKIKKITLSKTKNDHYKIVDEYIKDLTNFDVILIRQDPPFDMNYITTTYILESIKNKVKIINNPSEIRNCPEKIFISKFPEFITKTIITSSSKEILDFINCHGDSIIKPLYSCGGDGIVMMKKGDVNLNSIVEIMSKTYNPFLMVQKFIPEISDGDKRILMLDGEVLGVVARIAKSGEIRSNLHVGGSASKCELSLKQQKICKEIGIELKNRGLFFVGMDMIGDFITEINVTSPTCINEINDLYNLRIEEDIVNKIETNLKKTHQIC